MYKINEEIIEELTRYINDMVARFFNFFGISLHSCDDKDI
jgi:hypothetical protein